MKLFNFGGNSVDINVSKKKVIISVGDAQHLEIDAETETEAYEIQEEYAELLQEFMHMLVRLKGSPIHE